MIRPEAVATISTLPKHAHTRATQNNAMRAPLMAPAIAGGGVSTISSAAGRKASSRLRPGPARVGISLRKCASNGLSDRPRGPLGRAPSPNTLADFMEACLQTVQRRITAACPDQDIMGAVLGQTAMVDGDEAVGPPHGRQPMRNDEDGAAFGEARHVLLDDPLALVVERARRLVEDQDARVGDEGARDGQAL